MVPISPSGMVHGWYKDQASKPGEFKDLDGKALSYFDNVAKSYLSDASCFVSKVTTSGGTNFIFVATSGNGVKVLHQCFSFSASPAEELKVFGLWGRQEYLVERGMGEEQADSSSNSIGYSITFPYFGRYSFVPTGRAGQSTEVRPFLRRLTNRNKSGPRTLARYSSLIDKIRGVPFC